MQVLYKHIPDKLIIKTSKRASSIEHKDAEVTVHCDDGSSYSGDMVIGADGVPRVVRPEMQKHMKTRGLGGLIEKDENFQ